MVVVASNPLEGLLDLEIERAAEEARERLRAQLALLGLPLDRATDIQVAATLLIPQSLVKSYPNLITNEGKRVGGMLFQSNGVTFLYFEKYDPPVRQRFSIGHELGHYELHAPRDWTGEGQPTGDQGDVSDPERDERQEREADAFAAAFLLPREELLADCERFGRCAAFLAERYTVSVATMCNQLATLERLGR